MEKLFQLGLRGTDKKTEIIAGLTTFMTMAYVLAVQPAAICGGEAYITDVNGVVITKSAIMITCALVSGLITLLMAFYTNFPFALSTGMGSNFILGALIQSQALSFGSAMAITLISGIVFVLLTVFAGDGTGIAVWGRMRNTCPRRTLARVCFWTPARRKF